MLAETPQGSGPRQFLWAASSCSPCSQSYLYSRSHFAAQPHTSSHSLQYHVRPQLCQFSPQMVKAELFSSSFIAFSCSQFHHCPTTLESMILSLTRISQCCPFPSPLPTTEYPHFSLLKTGRAMQSLKHQSPDSSNAPSATAYPDLWSIHQLSFAIWQLLQGQHKARQKQGPLTHQNFLENVIRVLGMSVSMANGGASGVIAACRELVAKEHHSTEHGKLCYLQTTRSLLWLELSINLHKGTTM